MACTACYKMREDSLRRRYENTFLTEIGNLTGHIVTTGEEGRRGEGVHPILVPQQVQQVRIKGGLEVSDLQGIVLGDEREEGKGRGNGDGRGKMENGGERRGAIKIHEVSHSRRTRRMQRLKLLEQSITQHGHIPACIRQHRTSCSLHATCLPASSSMERLV